MLNICGNWFFLNFLHEAMYKSSETQDSRCDPTKFAMDSYWRPEVDLFSKCGKLFKKTVRCDNMVHFIDEQSVTL